jgi:hypothetical protein
VLNGCIINAEIRIFQFNDVYVGCAFEFDLLDKDPVLGWPNISLFQHRANENIECNLFVV